MLSLVNKSHILHFFCKMTNTKFFQKFFSFEGRGKMVKYFVRDKSSTKCLLPLRDFVKLTVFRKSLGGLRLSFNCFLSHFIVRMFQMHIKLYVSNKSTKELYNLSSENFNAYVKFSFTVSLKIFISF